MTRFRRTKEEIALGLTAEEASKQRLVKDHFKKTKQIRDTKLPKSSLNRGFILDHPLSQGGEIVIRIRPGKDVDKDYFEHLLKQEIIIVEDNKFYSWLHTKLSHEFDQDSTKLFQEILNEGLGELISHPKFNRDNPA